MDGIDYRISKMAYLLGQCGCCPEGTVRNGSVSGYIRKNFILVPTYEQNNSVLHEQNEDSGYMQNKDSIIPRNDTDTGYNSLFFLYVPIGYLKLLLNCCLYSVECYLYSVNYYIYSVNCYQYRGVLIPTGRIYHKNNA